MILDALKYLVELGKNDNAPHLLPLPGGKTLLTHGAQKETLTNDPLKARDQLDSLADLVGWIERYATPGLPMHDRQPALFVGNESVIAICDRNAKHLTETASVDLENSEAWLALHEFIGGLTPRPLVKALRGPLNGCFDERYLGIYRRIDFKRLSAATAAVKHTGGSFGRSIELEAQSAEGEIPEFMEFALPVFSLPQCQPVSVRCAVEVLPEAEKIMLIPVGDALENAIRLTRQQIIAWLAAELNDVPIFAGVPSCH